MWIRVPPAPLFTKSPLFTNVVNIAETVNNAAGRGVKALHPRVGFSWRTFDSFRPDRTCIVIQMSDHDVANQATIAIQEVILSRLKAQDEVLHDILIQAKLTNGRVTTVERDFAVEKALRGRDRETDASATRERRITDEHQLQASLAKRASRGQLRSALAGAGASGLLLYIGHLVHFV